MYYDVGMHKCNIYVICCILIVNVAMRDYKVDD